jgi:hypothetical protein
MRRALAHRWLAITGKYRRARRFAGSGDRLARSGAERRGSGLGTGVARDSSTEDPMKAYVLSAATVISLATSGAQPIIAHDPCCPRGHGCPYAASDASSDVPRGGLYDLDTVTTLRGTVVAVTVLPAQHGRAGGMHVTLENEQGPLSVHLGPTWFLEREGVKLSKGDSLEVTGSVVGDDTRYVVAQELKQGTTVIRLRDDRGLPLWRGAGRR